MSGSALAKLHPAARDAFLKRLRESRRRRTVRRMVGAPTRRRRLRGASEVWRSWVDELGRLTPSRGDQPGVVCGCHTRGCGTCAETGGCGWARCAPCLQYGYQAPLAVPRTERRRALGGGLAEPASGMCSARAVQQWGRADVVDQGYAETALGAFNDVHSHNFAYTDFFGDKSETDARIARLVALQNANIGKIALSGMSTATNGFFDYPTSTVNDVTAYAASGDAMVHPMCQVLPPDLGTQAGVDEVKARLADGFVGVGELFVHGHHENFTEVLHGFSAQERFRGLFRLAAAAGVPAQVHWDIGNVEDATPTAEENWEQLQRLVGGVQLTTGGRSRTAEGTGATVILAHCGAGPASTDLDTGETDPHDFDLYCARIDELLVYHPEVYFDLAGMQLGDPTNDAINPVRRLYTVDKNSGSTIPTPLGNFLYERIYLFPSRFLFGLDCDDQFDVDGYDSAGNHYWGMADYEESIDHYLEFLDMRDDGLWTVQLTDAMKYDFLIGNFQRMFRPGLTLPIKSTPFVGPMGR